MVTRKISIVIPVYNEFDNIEKLFLRLKSVVATISQYRWEYIFVNDGSKDNSYTLISNLVSSNNDIKFLDLSRNFGKEIALTAGVHEAATSDAVICIDADLQHPPELIPLLLAEWECGAEMVVTIRTEIEAQPLLRRLGSLVYYKIMKLISGLDMQAKTTDFRLYDKKVISAFLRATERERMFRAIMDWLGFRRSYVEFKAPPREGGAANYSYAKLWSLALNSITSFSLWPLKLAGYLGVIISTISGFLFLWMVVNYLILRVWVYTPLAIVVVTNTFLIGIVLICIGLVALYVGIIHTEVINRPLYIVREKISSTSK